MKILILGPENLGIWTIYAEYGQKYGHMENGQKMENMEKYGL